MVSLDLGEVSVKAIFVPLLYYILYNLDNCRNVFSLLLHTVDYF